MKVTFYEHGQWWQSVATAPFRTDGEDCYEWGRDFHPDLPPWESLSTIERAKWEQIARKVEGIINS